MPRTTRTGGHRFAAWLLSVGTVLCAVDAGATQLEYQVKASYLYNFTQFIEWPVDAFVGSPRFNLCITDAEVFGAELYALQGERVQGREVSIHTLDRVEEAPAANCHLLFVGRRAVPARLPVQRGLLTIGETPGFLNRGGIINLVEVRGRIRFEIEPKAAERAGLGVSSRLMRLALQGTR